MTATACANSAESDTPHPEKLLEDLLESYWEYGGVPNSKVVELAQAWRLSLHGLADELAGRAGKSLRKYELTGVPGSEDSHFELADLARFIAGYQEPPARLPLPRTSTRS